MTEDFTHPNSYARDLQVRAAPPFHARRAASVFFESTPPLNGFQFIWRNRPFAVTFSTAPRQKH